MVAIFQWNYQNGQDTIPWVECNKDFWYEEDDMGADVCTSNKLGNGGTCGIAHCTGSITCHGC